MAYYCVAHLFQGAGNMYGSPDPNSQPLKAEELTDEVWDFVFRGGAFPRSVDEGSSAGEAVKKAKREFEFWYPMVSRSFSGFFFLSFSEVGVEVEVEFFSFPFPLTKNKLGKQHHHQNNNNNNNKKKGPPRLRQGPHQQPPLLLPLHPHRHLASDS